MAYITKSYDEELWLIIEVNICDTVSWLCKSWRLLIDTWASHSCLKDRFLEGLWMTPIWSSTVQTPSTSEEGCECFKYFVKIQFKDHKTFIETDISEVPLIGQDDIDWLLWRDVLDHWLLVVDWISRTYSLAF